ncbi:Rid family hydrolase [Lysobacter korlensis]|uniref:Rid family hydrolase n=1 Tax=Lysobacter korlensis TaxID=553636 RepID=A0ABV6RXT6_9GAMM
MTALHPLRRHGGTAVRSLNPAGWDRMPGFDQGQLRAVGEILTVAAQGPLDERGRLLHDGDLAAQLALSAANFEAVLTAAGMTWPNVAQLRICTTDMDGLLDVLDTLTDHLGEAAAHPPVSLAEVRRLPLVGMAVTLDGLALR